MVTNVNMIVDSNSNPKINQHMHMFDILTQELQSLIVEQKQTEDDITDRIVDLKKVLDLLQVTVRK